MMNSIIFAAIQWGVIGWVTLGTIVFIVLVAALGRGIAAAFPPAPEHMSNFKKPASARKHAAVAAVASRAMTAQELANVVTEETMAIIGAAVAMALNGQKFSIKTVQQIAPVPGPIYQNEWAREGVRTVAMSHDQFR